MRPYNLIVVVCHYLYFVLLNYVQINILPIKTVAIFNLWNMVCSGYYSLNYSISFSSKVDKVTFTIGIYSPCKNIPESFSKSI